MQKETLTTSTGNEHNAGISQTSWNQAAEGMNYATQRAQTQTHSLRIDGEMLQKHKKVHERNWKGQGAQEENLGYGSCAKALEGESSLCRDWTMAWKTVREFQVRRHNTTGKRGGAQNGAGIRWAIGCHRLQPHNCEVHQMVIPAGAAKRTWPAQSVVWAEAAIFVSIKTTLLDRKEASIKRATSETESGAPRLQYRPLTLHTRTGTLAAACAEKEG
jgi:hypothetical protein